MVAPDCAATDPSPASAASSAADAASAAASASAAVGSKNSSRRSARCRFLFSSALNLTACVRSFRRCLAVPSTGRASAGTSCTGVCLSFKCILRSEFAHDGGKVEARKDCAAIIGNADNSTLTTVKTRCNNLKFAKQEMAAYVSVRTTSRKGLCCCS